MIGPGVNLMDMWHECQHQNSWGYNLIVALVIIFSTDCCWRRRFQKSSSWCNRSFSGQDYIPSKSWWRENNTGPQIVVLEMQGYSSGGNEPYFIINFISNYFIDNKLNESTQIVIELFLSLSLLSRVLNCACLMTTLRRCQSQFWKCCTCKRAYRYFWKWKNKHYFDPLSSHIWDLTLSKKW